MNAYGITKNEPRVHQLLIARPRTVRLKIKGQTLQFERYFLTGRLFRSLALNPIYFRANCQILVMDYQTTAQFNQLLLATESKIVEEATTNRKELELRAQGSSEQQAGPKESFSALYPLSVNGDLDAVRREEVAALPDRSRLVVIGQNRSPIALKHEIMHDIFLGDSPNWNKINRRNFCFIVVRALQKALREKNQGDLNFFQRVNQYCKGSFDLDSALELDEAQLRAGTKIGPNLFTFAGECFVYAIETILQHQDPLIKALGRSPQGIDNLLRRHTIALRQF